MTPIHRTIMILTQSKHCIDFDNPALDASRVRKIILSQACQGDESLWAIRFYDPDDRLLRIMTDQPPHHPVLAAGCCRSIRETGRCVEME